MPTTREESDARALHAALVGLLPPAARVTVEGAGVHWKCDAALGVRACPVNCFGSEYAVRFRHDAADRATGRTSDADEGARAVADWLAGDAVAALHHRYAFVDAWKRGLAALEAAVLAARPELAGVEREWRTRFSEFHELHFRAGDRACGLSYSGNNAHPDARFTWDGCELFRFPAAGPARLAGVLALWLVVRARPSDLAAYPEADAGELGRYYEEGRPVEGEFVLSWRWIAEHFRGDCHNNAPGSERFVAEVRAAGYDRRLRAGQSMCHLVLSRSRRHGLRDDQPCLTFTFTTAGMRVHAPDGRHDFPAPRLTLGVALLLDALAAAPVD